MLNYQWDRFYSSEYMDYEISLIDHALEHDDDFKSQWMESVNDWWEKENSSATQRGELRAVSETAFRESMDSGKEEKLGKKGKTKYYWVTVNPDPQKFTLDGFKECIERMYSKKWIEAYAYVFETTEDNHVHSHGLIKATYGMAHARKECANTVKHICNVTNTNIFKFVLLDETAAKQKLSYMLGKKSAKKQKHVALSIEWRRTVNLLPIYYSEGPSILLDPRDVAGLPASAEDNVLQEDSFLPDPWEFDLIPVEI